MDAASDSRLDELNACLSGHDVRVLSRAEDMAPFLTDWRGMFRGNAVAVLQPGSTEAVAQVMRVCSALRLGVVPQGGNTGLCGGATPAGPVTQVVLSLARLNRVREIDTLGSTMTVEAGCILESVQIAAQKAGKFFPLSLAAEGSAQIGGVLATNAGGTAVLRYGNARDLVLGLEVVLADGSIWKGLRSLRKDNTGYSLRDLFVGSEGTLGIITAAVLKLFPMPRQRVTALAAMRSSADAVALLHAVSDDLGERLTAFEAFDLTSLRMVLAHQPDLRDPFDTTHPWYALVEASDTSPLVPLQAMAENAFEQAMEAGHIADVVLAATVAQSDALWKIRECITEAQKREGYALKHDVSIPISRIPEFLKDAGEVLKARLPGISIAPFGHFGDGNIHFNLRLPPGADAQAGEIGQHLAAELVYEVVARLQGSFSAEHGIGQLKVAELARYKSHEETSLYREIKKALDPNRILNSGKIFEAT